MILMTVLVLTNCTKFEFDSFDPTTVNIKMDIYHMKKSDAAYLAGLFDGEGCVTYRQIMKKRYDNPAYKTWDIRLEINMTHQSVIRLIHEMTGCRLCY